MFHPGVITWFYIEYLFYGFAFVFSEVKGFLSFFIENHSPCKIYWFIHISEQMQRFDIILDRFADVPLFVFKICVFVTLYLSKKHMICCGNICFC